MDENDNWQYDQIELGEETMEEDQAWPGRSSM
ncbi:unnamed protein product [Staurois parvus]|uniref:Uncharacterized protein n=1 Tax=Staurois parvus TaxID=386267 RepID=A0ABN9FP65_9NEOB|nr:unnamed protein product [Staurois parvus]